PVPQLAKIAGDSAASPSFRTAAFDALRDIGNKGEVVARLKELAAKNQDLPIRRQAAAALAAVYLSASIPLIIDVLRETKNEEDALTTWRSVLTVKGAGAALASAIGKAPLSEPAAKAGLRAAREGARSEADLVLALARWANLSGQPQELTRAEIDQIARHIKD